MEELIDYDKTLLANYDKNINPSNKEKQVFDVDDIAFPETARWALCGLKNLTRPPSKNTFAAEKLLQCNILPILFNTVTVKNYEYPEAIHDTTE